MSWTEIGLILLIGVVLFGKDNRLPEMARSLGEAIGEFKRAMSPSEPPPNTASVPTDDATGTSEPDSDDEADTDDASSSPPPA